MAANIGFSATMAASKANGHMLTCDGQYVRFIILDDDKSVSADAVKDVAEELGIYPVHIVMKRPDGTTEHQGYRFV